MAGKIPRQRFDILFEYKILVIHIVSKVFNTVVKKYFFGNNKNLKEPNKQKLPYRKSAD